MSFFYIKSGIYVTTILFYNLSNERRDTMYNRYDPYNMNMPYNMNSPYGVNNQPYNNYNTPLQTNTNKIFVSGMEEVKNRQLPPSSDYFFLDNDKPIIYQKIVDSKGQFTIKQFKIDEFKEETPSEYKLTDYAKKSEIERISSDLEQIKKDISLLKGGESSGQAT